MIRTALLIGALVVSAAGRVPTAGAATFSTGAWSGAAAHERRALAAMQGVVQPADPADSLYRAARDAMSNGDYPRAAKLFERVANTPKSAYAGDAMYWQAFTLYKVGGTDDLRLGLMALANQGRAFPNAKSRGEARTLEARIRGEMAKRGDEKYAAIVTEDARKAPTSTSCDARASDEGDDGDDDNDLKIVALNALMQMDAERAVPILKQVLEKRDVCSVPLRRRAIFILSQKHAPEVTAIMVNSVRNDPDRSVRKQGVFWLGQVRTEAAAQALEDVLRGSGDDDLKEQAIRGLMEQKTERGYQAVRRLAEDAAASPQLREQAIFWIGQRRTQENADFQRALFGRLGKGGENDRELQEKVLFSLSQMRGIGNEKWLLQIASDPQYSIDVRKHALWTAQQAKAPAADLVAVYDRAPERELKEQAIWVLSQTRDPVAMDKLVSIVRSEKDVELRKKALFWLGQSKDPRVQQLLIDIINQPD